MIRKSWKNRFLWVLVLGGIIFLGVLSRLMASIDEDEDIPQQPAAVHVGGLLFDVDEGVKIEKGGGGSVYLRSNREYMQQKFRFIERQLDDLENRVKKLESREMSSVEAPEPEETGGTSKTSYRVLRTP